jgi:hypothetical protein
MTTDDASSAFLSRLLIAFTIELDNEFEPYMPHKTALFGQAGREPQRWPIHGSRCRRMRWFCTRGGYPDGS